MKSEFELKIYTDGGARGNPGFAAYGFVIYKNGELLFEEGKNIGEATNNVAEYTAVVEALKYLVSSIEYSVLSIKFFMDSMLVAEQLSGRWKIKNENLRSLYHTIKELEQKIGGKISYQHVRRKQNQEADRLVNQALDNRL